MRALFTAPGCFARHLPWLAAAALVSGCASFDFGGSGLAQSAAASRGASPAVVGTVLTRVPAGESASVLSNRSGSGLRVLVTAIDDAAAEISAAALPGSTAACASTGTFNLALSGQSALLLLADGCALQVAARGTMVAVLRLQVEAAAFAR